ncbi:MAG: peptidoglycan DD-metalloendopeptidase family protein [Woeseiaceae bacterium]|nr:peptidoglycan DD-metalloendopeptidase family protein [Woeseiaceae bacterium]
MHRPTSPLLHDYKPTQPRRPGTSRAFMWFAVGLGIPLLALGLAGLVDRPAPPPAMVAEAPSLTAAPPEHTTPVAAPVEPVISPIPLVLLPEPEFDTLTLTIRSGDTLDKLFRQHQLDLGHLAMIARLDEAGRQFRRIKPGDVFEIEHDEGRLVSMYTALSLTEALKVERDGDAFRASYVERPIDVRRRQAHGVIETSLFESAAAAGLSDKVIMNVAGIFAWDVDFVLDIRKGDQYYLMYEEIWQDGEFVTDGEIIAAEFVNDGRTYQAIRFVDDSGRADYFTPDGLSVRKAFIRAPVDFTRISSNFNPRRRHPILNTIRAHRGVDYAAPRGTPIKAAGDGKVIFRGVKGGYGNAVILQHGGNITTLYAHMSKFASQARVGARVRQGQTIGYVGSSGLATASHLHYEYRVNGVHRNPRTVELPKADPIGSEYRERFLATAQPILEELERFKTTKLATIALADR